MNHWQLVISDIWSVARYAMPVVAIAFYSCGSKLSKENLKDEASVMYLVGFIFLANTWLCMAGYL